LIEVWLEAQKDFEDLPGITAIAVKDQQLLWSNGFGMANREEGVMAEPSTIFSICSISKLFTSVAIMKLYDEGKLRLDDEIGDLLPWFNLEQHYPKSGPINVRSLLTHSSGLPREAAYPYWTGPDFPFPTSDEIREKLGDQETLYPASTYFQYSNLGLTLLGEIISEITGQPYEEYIRINILDPLGLDDTRIGLPEDLYGNQLAIGYSSIDRSGERNKVQLFQAEGISPAAGFSSNVKDLATFASWQFRLLDTTATEILKPSTLKEMHRAQWIDPDWKTTWGLGFSVRKSENGGTVIGHGGSCPGYRTQLSIYPKSKMAFSVMINASGANPQKYINGIKAILDKVDEKESKDKKPYPGLNLDEYTGFYSEQPWWSESYVSPWQGKLVIINLPADSPEESMTFFKHIDGDVFQRIRDDGELGEKIWFDRDGQNKVVRYWRHDNFSEKIER
jgi:CubicO group peptidase (beta-lactamase class C family)